MRLTTKGASSLTRATKITTSLALCLPTKARGDFMRRLGDGVIKMAALLAFPFRYGVVTLSTVSVYSKNLQILENSV